MSIEMRLALIIVLAANAVIPVVRGGTTLFAATCGWLVALIMLSMVE